MENCNTHLSSEALTPPTLSTKKNLEYEGSKNGKYIHEKNSEMLPEKSK